MNAAIETHRLARGVLLITALALGALPAVGADEAPAPASADAPTIAAVEIRVTGMGWFRNRKLRQTLGLLEPEDDPLREADAAFIEDAVVLLQSALEREGFLRSTGTVEVREKDNGMVESFAWTSGDVPQVPRNIAADRVVFALDPGVRYYFDSLKFSGLASVSVEHARAYFLEEGLLLGGASARRFTPGTLRSGIANLREQLVRLGLADASVQVVSEQRNDETGAVAVAIAVREGKIHRVAHVTLPANLPEAIAAEVESAAAAAVGTSFSPLWQQDFVQAIRALFYRHGYAEAEVSLRPTDVIEESEEIRRDFELVLHSGPQVRIGSIDFGGDPRTAESVLRRAVDLQPGDLFDRGRVDEDRLRLGGLGVFSSVRAETEKTDSAVAAADQEIWDLTYLLQPGKELEVSLLAGYGSYEQLRGGLEVFHANYFRRAHRGRLKLIHSMRASSGEYQYTVPQIFGTSTDASARVFGLAREEVSFDRREIGASIGAKRHLGFLGADVAVRYQYESVTAENITGDLGAGVQDDTFVGAVTVDVTRDRLDNPISPRRGYAIAATLETASKVIGGEVDYQRFDFRAVWHLPVGGERYVHLGLRHGLIWSTGEVVEEVPPGRRFYPGGEGTIRGYREGDAAPHDAAGEVIGAQVSTILNIELEQRLTREFSAVLFVDGGLTGRTLDHYPGGQGRVSVGLGLRYDTVIGPARLEYGYNVLRQDVDPAGTLHFALGFPF